MPLIYVKLVWLQHIFLCAFWVGIYLSFKKIPLYSTKVKESVLKYEDKEKCRVQFDIYKKIIDFNIV